MYRNNKHAYVIFIYYVSTKLNAITESNTDMRTIPKYTTKKLYTHTSRHTAVPSPFHATPDVLDDMLFLMPFSAVLHFRFPLVLRYSR